jgi:hypothetical protein
MHPKTTIIHKTLWNQLSGIYKAEDIHLLDMLYSNLYNKYTCAKSQQVFLQERGLLASLDNLLPDELSFE